MLSLLVVVSIVVSFVVLFRKIDHKIVSLTSATSISSKSTNQKGDNITVTITSVADASEQIVQITKQLKVWDKEVQALEYRVHLHLSNMNNTVQRANATKDKVNEELQQAHDNVSSQSTILAYQFAGTFTVLGSIISVGHMSNHLRFFNEPIVQRKIIAILWMIPIYSVSSFLGLVIVSFEDYFAFIKDIYESYCIYTFLSFLIAVLGRGDRGIVIDLLAEHADHLKPPISFSIFKRQQVFESPQHKAEVVLDQCQFFAMQFVFVRPLTSVAMLVSDALHESRWDMHYPQFYLMIITNISVFLAFTGLLKIYHAIQEELKWCHPFSKFLCIKGVVFMTFWQGVLISVAAQAMDKYHNDYYQNDDDTWDKTQWSKKTQSFLICFEMFFFAIIHCFVFPTEEWEEGFRQKVLLQDNVKLGFDESALGDFFRDIKFIMGKKEEVHESGGNNNVLTSENTISDDELGGATLFIDTPEKREEANKDAKCLDEWSDEELSPTGNEFTSLVDF